MDLKGKNALVTGAARRLGKAITLALAKRGMNIAVHYHHSKEAAQELAQTIEGMGSRVVIVGANCANQKEIYAATDKVFDSFKNIHLLINNAAIFGPSELNEIDEDEWNRYLDINLKAPFYFAQRLAQKNSAQIAKIINMSDTYGLSPAAKFLPYGVSKGALIDLTKGLAKALAPNILVNCICPGPIVPAEDKTGTASGHYTEHNQKAIGATLLKRQGDAQDIVKTVLFLAENDYITGQAIFVDGGKSV